MKDAGPVIELTEDPRPWWLAPAQTSSRQCPECGETMHVDRLAKLSMSLSHYFVVAVPCAHCGAAVPASGWLKVPSSSHRVPWRPRSRAEACDVCAAPLRGRDSKLSCRNCGNVACPACTSRAVVRGYGADEQTVCRGCTVRAIKIHLAGACADLQPFLALFLPKLPAAVDGWHTVVSTDPSGKSSIKASVYAQRINGERSRPFEEFYWSDADRGAHAGFAQGWRAFWQQFDEDGFVDVGAGAKQCPLCLSPSSRPASGGESCACSRFFPSPCLSLSVEHTSHDETAHTMVRAEVVAHVLEMYVTARDGEVPLSVSVRSLGLLSCPFCHHKQEAAAACPGKTCLVCGVESEVASTYGNQVNDSHFGMAARAAVPELVKQGVNAVMPSFLGLGDAAQKKVEECLRELQLKSRWKPDTGYLCAFAGGRPLHAAAVLDAAGAGLVKRRVDALVADWRDRLHCAREGHAPYCDKSCRGVCVARFSSCLPSVNRVSWSYRDGEDTVTVTVVQSNRLKSALLCGVFDDDTEFEALEVYESAYSFKLSETEQLEVPRPDAMCHAALKSLLQGLDIGVSEICVVAGAQEPP